MYVINSSYTYLSVWDKNLTNGGTIPASIMAVIGGLLSLDSIFRAACVALNCLLPSSDPIPLIISSSDINGCCYKKLGTTIFTQKGCTNRTKYEVKMKKIVTTRYNYQKFEKKSYFAIIIDDRCVYSSIYLHGYFVPEVETLVHPK